MNDDDDNQTQTDEDQDQDVRVPEHDEATIEAVVTHWFDHPGWREPPGFVDQCEHAAIVLMAATEAHNAILRQIVGEH
jgi:hypothetical protein